MKKLIITTLAIGVLSYAGSVYATPMTFDVNGSSGGSYVNLTDNSWLGGISANLADLGGMSDFTLNDNSSFTFDFFTFYVQPDADWGFGLGPFSVDANLSFASPEIDVAGQGDGFWFGLSGLFSAGVYNWDVNSFDYTLNGNHINISLLDGFTLTPGNSATITATVTNYGTEAEQGNPGAGTNTAPVPEPGTMLLLGAGLAGLVGVSRRRKKANPA